MLKYARHWKIDPATLAQNALTNLERDFADLLQAGIDPHTDAVDGGDQLHARPVLLALAPNEVQKLDGWCPAGTSVSDKATGIVRDWLEEQDRRDTFEDGTTPPLRTFKVTLTKRAAFRLRDFVRLFNVPAEDALAALAGEQIACLDEDETFELHLGRLAVEFRRQREATAKVEEARLL